MFHVVHIKFHGAHVGYEIWWSRWNGAVWDHAEVVVSLKDMWTPDGVPCSCFKRHEAYRLARAWNAQ